MASTIVHAGLPNEQLEKPASVVAAASTTSGVVEEQLPVPKPYRFGPFKIPNYYSATTQVFIAGFVNFLAVGTSR